MMFGYDVYKLDCPTRKVLNDLSDKWVVLVIGLLQEKSYRFSDLLKGIEGVSQKMLTQTLRKLERNGLVSRTVDSTAVPISVSYELTGTGRTLVDSISAFSRWSEENIEYISKSQQIYDKKHATRP